MTDTKQRLVEGTLPALRRHGITGVSARTIAAAAGDARGGAAAAADREVGLFTQLLAPLDPSPGGPCAPASGG
ncbi:hypothetical protein Acy02nite_91810 [Actinoplanes cyaneus]|uniref:Uncharacterized protein n=1 Tax=Actinoplanes cyaneus TaxID=52696 RepID=A0A919M6A0_9ACTN|nr:hypothetical protein [Actinoplanes cyaneus]GID71300.1 hypothetical protein Acy02nite_91810 [Actinoplanes cyaneus]